MRVAERKGATSFFFFLIMESPKIIIITVGVQTGMVGCIRRLPSFWSTYVRTFTDTEKFTGQIIMRTENARTDHKIFSVCEDPNRKKIYNIKIRLGSERNE